MNKADLVKKLAIKMNITQSQSRGVSKHLSGNGD